MKYVLLCLDGLILDKNGSLIGDSECISAVMMSLYERGVGLNYVTRMESNRCRGILSAVFPVTLFRTTSSTALDAAYIRWIATTYETEPDCSALLVITTDWGDVREARRAGAACLLATGDALSAVQASSQ